MTPSYYLPPRSWRAATFAGDLSARLRPLSPGVKRVARQDRQLVRSLLKRGLMLTPLRPIIDPEDGELVVPGRTRLAPEHPLVATLGVHEFEPVPGAVRAGRASIDGCEIAAARL